MFKFRKGTWNYMYSVPISINREESFFLYMSLTCMYTCYWVSCKYTGKKLTDKFHALCKYMETEIILFSVNFGVSRLLLVMKYTVNGKYRHIQLYK